MGHTFALVAACLFLGICSFSASLIKGKEIERKVTKFELYSRFRISSEPGIR